MYKVGTRRDYLIGIISSRGDRYGNGPGSSIEFMDKYGLHCLRDATVEQLEEFAKLYDWMDETDAKEGANNKNTGCL